VTTGGKIRTVRLTKIGNHSRGVVLPADYVRDLDQKRYVSLDIYRAGSGLTLTLVPVRPETPVGTDDATVEAEEPGQD